MAIASASAPAAVEAAQQELEALVLEALDNNSGVEATRLAYEAALERVPQARAYPEPRIGLTRFLESVQTRTGPQERVFSVNQTIPWPGKLARRADAAEAEAGALWWAHLASQVRIATNVSLLYYELAFLKRAEVLAEENLSLLQRLESVATETVRGGGGLDALLRLQVETGRVGEKLVELRQEAKIVNAQLAALLSLAPEATLEVAPSIAETLPAREGPWTRADFLRENPNLQALDFKVRSRRATVALAKLEVRPDFALGLTYIDVGEAMNPATSGSGEDPVSVGVSINLPIWQAKNRARRQEAVLERRAARERFEDLETELQGELEALRERLEYALRRAEIYGEDLLPKARQAVEITESAYRAGRTSLLELIDSQRTLLDLELSLSRARADAWKQATRLKALGGGVYLFGLDGESTEPLQ